MAEDSDFEKVTLIVKNVDPIWRSLFNGACRINGEDRGDAINELFKQKVLQTYGGDLDFHYRQEVKAFENRARRNEVKKQSSPDSDDLSERFNLE